MKLAFIKMVIVDLLAFKTSIQEPQSPSEISVYLRSLWFFKKGNWNESHDLIQHLPDSKAAHIHAFLHREEGDIWNADYWYRQAGRIRPDLSIAEEWEQIVIELLNSD